MKLFAALFLSGIIFAGNSDTPTEKKKTDAAIKFILGGKTASVVIPLCRCEDIGFSCCHLPGPGLPECKYDPYCTTAKPAIIPRQLIEEKKEREVAIVQKPPSVYCCPSDLGQCQPPFGPCPPPNPPVCDLWHPWNCPGGGN